MSEPLWAKDLPLDAEIHRFTVGLDPVTDLEILAADAAGSAAHARMLGERGFLPEGEARALVGALAGLRQAALRREIPILPEEEDGHTALEHALVRRLGDTGKRIHLARSRNDQVATALRIFMRDRALDLGAAAHQAASAFLDLAAREKDAQLPGYTHLRKAMPASWGMWGAAFAEGLLEELEALEGIWDRLDRCPLGAAAGFGAPIPLDRERSAQLLGFSRVQRSPMDVMNSRGRYEQALAAWVVSAAGTLEKAIWDLNLYSTEAFGFVKLPDAFTTGSSLMPQKRNPDALELARARCRELRGLAGLLGHLAGGLPSSYHRDHQLLKAPFVEILAKGEELFRITARLLAGIEVDREACRAACTQEIHAAARACRLAAEGLPFRDAYVAVAKEIQSGTFVPENAAAAPLDLDAIEASLSDASRWLARKRAFLQTTFEQLFTWGKP